MKFSWYWCKMTEYHKVKVNLSDFQLNKLKSTAENATGVTFRLSWDKIGTEKLILSIIYYQLIAKSPVFARLLKMLHKNIKL